MAQHRSGQRVKVPMSKAGFQCLSSNLSNNEASQVVTVCLSTVPAKRRRQSFVWGMTLNARCLAMRHPLRLMALVLVLALAYPVLAGWHTFMSHLYSCSRNLIRMAFLSVQVMNCGLTGAALSPYYVGAGVTELFIRDPTPPQPVGQLNRCVRHHAFVAVWTG